MNILTRFVSIWLWDTKSRYWRLFDYKLIVFFKQRETGSLYSDIQIFLVLTVSHATQSRATSWQEVCSAKCVIRCFCLGADFVVHLHRPAWYSLLHTWAVWCGLLLLGSKPVQHVTTQNIRLNQAQAKMMQSGDVNTNWGCCWHNTTYYFIATFFLIRKNELSWRWWHTQTWLDSSHNHIKITPKI